MKRSNLNLWLGILPCLLLSVVSLVSCGSKADGEDVVEMYAVQFENDGRWSFLDKKGNIVYKDEFKGRVTNVINGFFAVINGEENEATLYKAKEKPERVLGCDDLVSVGVCNEGLIPIAHKNGRICVINEDGLDVFELNQYKGQEVAYCYYKFTDGMLQFELENGGCGYYDKSGKVVIEPKYDTATPFSEGLAVVGKKINDEIFYEVIDKSGKTVFKLKEGMCPTYLSSNGFINGRLVVEDKNNEIFLFDKKGKDFKLPTKVKSVVAIGSNTIIYYAGDGCGLMKYDGEILIRPTYINIQFISDNKLLAQTENNCFILNKQGDKLSEFENLYSVRYLFPGILGALENNTIFLVDYNGKQVGKEEFYDINVNNYINLAVDGKENYEKKGYISSNYFNAKAVADALTNPISVEGVGEYKFGTLPSTYLDYDYPEIYRWKSSFKPENLIVNGFHFSIQGEVYCSNNITDYYPASHFDSWNVYSRIWGCALLASMYQWTREDTKIIINNLEKKDFKVIFHPIDNEGSKYAYLLVNGKTFVILLSDDSSKEPWKIGLFVYYNLKGDPEFEENITNIVKDFILKENSQVSEDNEIVEVYEDTVAVTSE